MNLFQAFALAIHTRFNELAGTGELFVTDLDKDMFYATYLKSFPQGTNPIFRERTEHDCSCCRNFIKNLGMVVGLDKNGQILTVWDNIGEEHGFYAEVAWMMRTLLTQGQITSIYRTSEASYGAEFTLEKTPDLQVRRWNHFHGKTGLFQSNDVGPVVNKANTTAAVFARGLKEITSDAVQTVMELIAAKALYRGDEFLPGVASFQKLQQAYDNLPLTHRQENFPWAHYQSPGARIRNTAMGQLLQDLSDGADIERAVKAFESMVAPTNYKRTTALITKPMIDKALAVLRGLDLESAVNRRFAKISDVSINNVIWADSAAKAKMRDQLADVLLGSTQVKPASSKLAPVDITIEHFMDKVVPLASEMSVLFKGSMVNNLVSLTAPVDESVGNLFQWDNNFGWSYNGNITDSITEKVKRAGGATEGKLRVSLAWFNPDDLDISCHQPDGDTIYFGNKRNVLDVDMNAHGKSSATEPVENLNWTNPRDGQYRIAVNQYNKRSNDRPGFVLEVQNNGQITHYSFNKAVTGNRVYLTFNLVNGVITNMVADKELVGEGIKQEVWGLTTETLVPVETMMFSPNLWDENQKGNKHYLFMLRDCLNDQPARGIYNEFLRPELYEHRKVFEVLAGKTMCPVADSQLSGVGFSSTKGEKVTVQATLVNGQTVSYNVQF